MVATVAKKLTGAGIGIGGASKFKEPPLVTVSAAAAGMIGAYAKTIIGGTLNLLATPMPMQMCIRDSLSTVAFLAE